MQEQGPGWLIEILSNPPTWLLGVMVAIAVATVGLSVLSYQRNEGLDQEVLEEMGEIGTIVLSIVICSNIWIQAFETGYVVTVLGGTTVGFAVARTFIWAYHESEKSSLSAAEQS